MNDFLSILEKLGSILAVLGVFILWVFSRNFVSKEELKKELRIIEEEFKSVYNNLSEQKIDIATLNTKMDNLIKSVDCLNLAVNDIKEYLINRKTKGK